MTSFNTGTSFSNNTSTTASFTVPAGVNAGDLMVLGFTVFCEVSSAPTIAFSGGGGSWTLPTPLHDGSNPEGQASGGVLFAYGYFYYRVATAGDIGATITLTETGSSGVTTWWAGVLGAYPGAAGTQPDVAGSKGVNNATTGTSPAETTGVAGAWSLEMLLGGTGTTGTPAAPGSLTTRESVTSSAGVTAILADSAASVGGSGTSIGGETWTGGNSAPNNTWTVWTISLAPASGSPAGTVQPRATVTVPRRAPARAVWRGGAGPAFAAVAAPRQQPRPAPRRQLARAVVRGTPLAASNAPPAIALVTPRGGVLPCAGGITLAVFAQVFTSNGSFTGPADMAFPPAVYARGPGNAGATNGGAAGGGGGAGGLGGEPALAGAGPGVTLTVTVGAANSGADTTVTGGAVVVRGRAGSAGSAASGGAGGPASGNAVAFKGGDGGAGGGTFGGGGGGGGSAGSTGAGGNGGTGGGSSGGAAGTAGTGPGVLAGAAGGLGAFSAAAGAGVAPGGGGGGNSPGGGGAAAGGAAGQAVIIWQTWVTVLMMPPRRVPSRAVVRGSVLAASNSVTPPPAGSVQPRATVALPRRVPSRGVWRGNAVAGIRLPAPAQQYRTPPRRAPRRAVVQFRPVATVNAAPQAVAAPRQQPRPAPRRVPARAFIRFTPVPGSNAPPAPVVFAGQPPRGDDDRNRLLRRSRWSLSRPVTPEMVIAGPPPVEVAAGWPGVWPVPLLPPEPEPEPVIEAPVPEPEPVPPKPPRMPVYQRPPKITRTYPEVQRWKR